MPRNSSGLMGYLHKGLGQPPETTPPMQMPEPPDERPIPGAKIPEHALERMREARLHVERSVKAAEVLGERFEEFSRLIGPEKANLAAEQIRSYVSRATKEFIKAKTTIETLAEEAP